MLRPIKVKTNTIELTMHTSRILRLDLLPAKRIKNKKYSFPKAYVYDIEIIRNRCNPHKCTFE